MISPRLGRAAMMAVGTAILLGSLSCDALNPEFVNDLGGNALKTSPDPTGNIVIVFNNQRLQQLTLSYTLEVTFPGEATQQVAGGLLTTGTGYWTTTLDCFTTGITINSIVVGGAASQPSTQPSTQPSGSDLTLATNVFRAPALQCGSVLFVNVPLIGSPTAELVP